MTDEPNTPLGAEHAHAADDDADDRASPFPYAERFDEWVADETEAPHGRRTTPEASDERDGN